MKKNLIFILLSLVLSLVINCSSEQVKEVDPFEAINATLKPARIQGFGNGAVTVDKAKLADWEKNFLPIVKKVHDELPAGTKLQVRGNADAEGDAKVNQEIGLKRAKGIYDLLLKKGFKAEKMVFVSLGEEQAMAGTNANDDGNRRVNFRVVKE